MLVGEQKKYDRKNFNAKTLWNVYDINIFLCFSQFYTKNVHQQFLEAFQLIIFETYGRMVA